MLLVTEKLDKILGSIERVYENLKDNNKRAAIGDLDYIKDNALEIIFILLAELEEEEE